MSEERFFDDLARTLAEPMPRRRAVRGIGVSLAAIVLPGVSPPHARGATSSNHGCGDDVRACPRIVNLGTAPPKCCGAPARRYICEGTPADPICKDTCTTGVPCKSTRKDQDGFSYFACCKEPQQICLNGECAPNCALEGKRQCGKACCEPTQRCENGRCVANRCGGKRCQSAQSCCPGTRLMPQSRCYDPKTHCCTPVKGVVPKRPITNLDWCPNRVPKPGHTPAVNGCGPMGGVLTPLIPNTYFGANFKPACDFHDRCWGTCNNEREMCDRRFQELIRAECRSHFRPGLRRLACYRQAVTYRTAVSSFLGTSAYEDAQRDACNCC